MSNPVPRAPAPSDAKHLPLETRAGAGGRLGLFVHARAVESTARRRADLRKCFHCLTQSGVVWRNVPPARWIVAERPR